MMMFSCATERILEAFSVIIHIKKYKYPGLQYRAFSQLSVCGAHVNYDTVENFSLLCNALRLQVYEPATKSPLSVGICGLLFLVYLLLPEVS